MNPLKKILVLGGTGFTGRQVLKQLEIQDAIEVTCLVRSSSNAIEWSGKLPLKIVVGDLGDTVSLNAAFKNQDMLIFVASMGFGHMQNVVNSCLENNVKRAVFTSSTAIFTRLPAQSKDGRQAGEKQIMESSFDWTILRPTMIFGRKGDRNLERLVKNLKKFPLFFVPGPGQALQQPIFVDDVAKAVIQALATDKSVRKAYNISGEVPLTFNQLVISTASALGLKRAIVNLPLWPVQQAVKLYSIFAGSPKISEEQILRLNENKAFDHKDAQTDFGFTPISFNEGIKFLVKELS